MTGPAEQAEQAEHTGPAILRATILGSGSSGGVPRPGGPDGRGDWGKCDPKEPKNRRTRCSLLLQRVAAGTAHDPAFTDPAAQTTALIDTSPDMRAQLLAARCARLDGVLYTHAHADQSHGIDDLRVFAIAQRAQVPVWIDPHTAGELLERFDYCFMQSPGSPYPAILDHRAMPAMGQGAHIDGPSGALSIVPFLQFHGSVESLGFRCGDIAYSSDVVDLPEESFDLLRGVKTWIVDALQERPHATHAHLDKTLAWIERVKPARAILTNLHVSMDYQSLRTRLPGGVEPAYDGMIVECPLPVPAQA
ncbi:MAG: MBL fold metallo-hydrolase [Pseudomonadota bacterium]